VERDEFFRRLWRMEVSYVDPERLMFGVEMGTHNSLAPLYAYAPTGAPSSKSRETAGQIPRSWRAFMHKGWGLLCP
jgi:hypothetical protein